MNTKINKQDPKKQGRRTLQEQKPKKQAQNPNKQDHEHEHPELRLTR
jgi:hypothetical protein